MAAADPSESPLSVLVIEDDADVRELLTLALEAPAWDLRAAGDGPEALALIDQGFDPAVALVDCDLPGMHGFDVIEKLRARGADPAVLIITGVGTVRTAEQALELGVAAFISKPFDIFELIEAAQRLGNRARARRRRLRAASLEDVTQNLRAMRERLASAGGPTGVHTAAVCVEPSALVDEVIRHLADLSVTARAVGIDDDIPVTADLVVVGAATANATVDLAARAREAIPDAVVVALGPVPSIENVARLIQLEVATYVEEPTRPDGALRSKLRAAVRHRRAGER